MPTTALWERIDVPGHDACQLVQVKDGWKLQGMAVFRHEVGPASIEYLVECDLDWQCRSGQIRGWLGAHKWQLVIQRSENGSWSLNNSPVRGLQGCVDLDYGFTPATNLTQLRRIDIEIGRSVDVPVAWIDLPEATLSLLPQRYERRSSKSYWYESSAADYAGLIEVADSGFAKNYPGLWRMVSGVSST